MERISVFKCVKSCGKMGTALEVRVGVGIRVRLILADFWQNDKSRRKGREKRRKRREKQLKRWGFEFRGRFEREFEFEFYMAVGTLKYGGRFEFEFNWVRVRPILADFFAK